MERPHCANEQRSTHNSDTIREIEMEEHTFVLTTPSAYLVASQ